MILLCVAESRVLVHLKGICLSWDCFQMGKKMRLGFIPSCSREKVVGKKHGCWFTHYVLETVYCNNHSVQTAI